MSLIDIVRGIVRKFNGSNAECGNKESTDASVVISTWSSALSDVMLLSGEHKRQSTKSKGYRVFTADGGKFSCASQADVADTLATLYGKPITRDIVHSAMQNFGGLVVVDNTYIAKVKYRKGEVK